MIFSVVRGSTFARAIAMAVLLVSAMNFAVFDLETQSVFPLSQSQPDDSCGDPNGGHDCFVCCGHLVPTLPLAISIQFEQVSTAEYAQPAAAVSEPILFFHPPKF